MNRDMSSASISSALKLTPFILNGRPWILAKIRVIAFKFHEFSPVYVVFDNIFELARLIFNIKYGRVAIILKELDKRFKLYATIITTNSVYVIPSIPHSLFIF